MNTETNTNMRLGLQIAMTALLTVLVGINGWALHELNALGKQVVQNSQRLDDFSSAGPRYSRYDAEKDFGVVTLLLESQGKIVDDHEGRIRFLEQNRNPAN